MRHVGNRIVVMVALGLAPIACQGRSTELEVIRVGTAAKHERIARESRPVLATVETTQLSLPQSEGCTLSIGYASRSATDAPEFTVSTTVAGGQSETLLQATPASAGTWFDHELPVPMNAELVTLTLNGSIENGVWSQPLVYCRRANKDSQRHNVLLVMLDTLRGDRVDAKRGLHPIMPNLSRAAREGVAFSEAYAVYPNTLASHATMFTGEYPSRHGMVAGELAGISPDETTLAGAFAEAGYMTVAFTENAFVSSEFGFDVGFDRYDDGPETSEKEMFPGGVEDTFSRAFDWLEARPDVPFFMFLHTYEVHGPYAPDLPLLHRLRQAFGSDYDGPYRIAFSPLTELAYNRRRTTLTQADLDYLEVLYDAESFHLDQYVGHLLVTLDKLGLTKQTLVVFTSDHGEEFSEHGFLGHGQTLHREALHVPFIFRLPGVVPSGLTLEAPVGLIDLAPTVSELAGIGTILADSSAQSLVPSILGGPESTRPVIGELNATIASCTDWKIGDFNVCPFDGISIRDGQYVYLDSKVQGWEKLYDAVEDPGETNDIAAHDPATLARYRALADSFRESASESSFRTDPIRIDESTREKLRSLGYID